MNAFIRPGSPEAAPIDPRSLFARASGLAGEPIPPREWLVPGLVPGGTVTMLGGDGGTGKSTLALGLAVATVAGVPWVGRSVEDCGPAAFLSAEDDKDELHRRLDAICKTKGDFDGEALRLRQNKSGKPLWLQCTPQLLAALSTAKKTLGAAPHPSRHILTKQDGQPMNYRRMARIFGDERKRLGFEAHDMHALRYRGVMELAWSNCTDDEIMAFSGHSSKAMVIKYAGIARQITRAKTAHEKRRLWSAL